VDGDVFDRAGSLSRLRTVHNNHTHTDSMGKATSAPNTLDR
jgi:hypothetical protein